MFYQRQNTLIFSIATLLCGLKFHPALATTINTSFRSRNIDPGTQVVQPKDILRQNLDTRIAQHAAQNIQSNIFQYRHQALLTKSQNDLSQAKLMPEGKKKFSNRQKNEQAMKQNHFNALKDESPFDTVAVRLNSYDGVDVAANVKTRTDPFIKRKFQTSNYGLRNTDQMIILDTLRKDPVLRNRPITISETQLRATNSENNAAPHAEMKLLAQRGSEHNAQPGPLTSSSKGRRGSVIGASKPACENCHNVLSLEKIPHNWKGGLAKENIKNWLSPSDIPELTSSPFSRVSNRRNSIAGPSSTVPRPTNNRNLPSANSLNRRHSISTHPVPSLNHDIKPMHYNLKIKPTLSWNKIQNSGRSSG